MLALELAFGLIVMRFGLKMRIPLDERPETSTLIGWFILKLIVVWFGAGCVIDVASHLLKH